MNTQLFSWFRGSVAVDDTGKPQIFYHGSSYNFDAFDLAKIRADETDAVYNGFWFTSQRDNASPAWRDPRFIKHCYLRLCNPAPHELARQIYKDARQNTQKYNHLPHRSYNDIVRFELQRLGYDGMIHNDKARINLDEYRHTGKTSFVTPRGTRYVISVDREFNGVDLYYANGELVTGYSDLEDFLSQHSERTLVVFDPRQVYVFRTETLR